MQTPLVLSAQAILKPRQGGLSLLDLSVVVTADNRKRFSADAANIKRVVEEFKKAGFSVSSVGKMSILINGPVYLFEQSFKVFIVSDETGFISVQNSARPGFIEPTEFLKNELEGVIINQNDVTYFGVDPPKGTDKICIYEPSQIPSLLGFGTSAQFLKLKLLIKKILEKSDYKVIIDVLDSGYYHKHSYFEKYRDIKVSEYYNREDAAKYEKDTKAEFAKLKDLYADLKTILRESKTDDVTQHPLYIKIQKDLTIPAGLRVGIGIAHTKEELVAFSKKDNSVDVLLRELKALEIFDKYMDDAGGHGTRVISNLLPILELLPIDKFEIRIHKDVPGHHANEFFDKFDVDQRLKINKNEIHVINCSYGTTQQWGKDKIPEHFPVLRNNIRIAVSKPNVTIVYASGNRSGDSIKYKSFQAQMPEVICVGGAYKDGDDIVASDYAHGYTSQDYQPPRTMPDVCGLCGPFRDNTELNGGFVWMPYYDIENQTETWTSIGGTSFAAPQVTAVCAILKLINPALTNDQLKQILDRTSDKIQRGEFFVPPEGDKSKAVDKGLVNIPKAILEAVKSLTKRN